MVPVAPTSLPDGLSDGPTGPGPNVRPRTKRFWWVLGTIVFVMLVVSWWFGQQSQPQYPLAPAAYCKATKRYETAIDHQAAVQRIDVAKQVALVDAIRDAADRAAPGRIPAGIRADIATFADAMDRVEVDRTVAVDPNVHAAVDRVNRYSSQSCGVFTRQGGI